MSDSCVQSRYLFHFYTDGLLFTKVTLLRTLSSQSYQTSKYVANQNNFKFTKFSNKNKRNDKLTLTTYIFLYYLIHVNDIKQYLRVLL